MDPLDVTESPQQPALDHRAPMDMPNENTSCVFFPRQKEGDLTEPGLLTRHISINYEALEDLYHLPLKDAAREVGLCSTTFKKACRHFNMKKWPFRKGQSKTPRGKLGAYGNARTDAVDAAITLHQATVCSDLTDAAIRSLHQTPVRAPASTVQTTEMHQDVLVSRTTSSSMSRTPSCATVMVSRTPSSSTGAASRTASSATTVRASSAALDDHQSLLQQASMALDTGAIVACTMPPPAISSGEAGHAGPLAGHAGPAFPRETFAPRDALSYLDSLTSSGHKGTRGHKGTSDSKRSQEDCRASQGHSSTPRGSSICIRQTAAVDAAIRSLHQERVPIPEGQPSTMVMWPSISSPAGPDHRRQPCGATLDACGVAPPPACRDAACVPELGGGGAGPIREQSCVEAVLEYLETGERFGSLGLHAGSFDFMFED